MKTLSALVSVLTLMAAWGMSAPAAAADFNFNVPVEAVNLPPSIDRGYVRCQVWFASGTTAINAGEAQSAEFAIVDRAYRGTARVEVTVRSGIRAAAVTNYDCWLWFRVTRADGRVVWYNATHLAQGDPYPLEARLLRQPSGVGSVGGPVPH